jgi:hypothetical protein
VKSPALAILGAALLGAGGPPAAAAAACSVLNYTFQPDCFRSAGSDGCAFDENHPDFGPQIAVWVGSADGSQFVDTLLATNAVAIHGIGNRPGTWNLRSGPRFPYGRRPMALPIWAHARGKLYDLVVMNDGLEDELTGHENVSSPEPYFCRPMLLSEVVDAITCPSGQFRSAKGLLDATGPPSYYPPRADIFDFGGAPCVPRGVDYPGSCDEGDSAQYFALNDVDTVAAATPPYGTPFTGNWIIPSDLPAGDYLLSVEVGKEFDGNASNQHPSEVSAVDQQYYAGYGQDGNVGQPSVLFQVPFTVGAAAIGTTAATAEMAGYGDWTGATGDVLPPDGTIGSDPGSGEGRLLLFEGPNGAARVALSIDACPTVDCTLTPAPAPLPVQFTATPLGTGTGVTLTVLESNEAGQAVLGYEARYALLAGTQDIDPSSFPAWTPAGTIAVGPPGSPTTLEIDGLAPSSAYAVGIRAKGVCGTSPITYQRFVTPARKFAQLSGCFIATAAFGSDLGPELATLRTIRDAATARSALARTAVDLYYRSSPPLAAAIATSDTARALVRSALRSFGPSGAFGR